MEDTFRRYFDELPCYVTVQDRDFRIVAHNRLFGRDFGEGVGGFCHEVYKGRGEKCPVCPVERTFGDGRPHASQEVVRRRDGTEIFVMVYASPIRDAAGTITAVLELSADITEVQRQQQKFRALFDEAPCYISVQDRELRLLDANRRFRDDFGDPVDGRCFEVYKHRDEPCVVCPVASTFGDGRSHGSEEVVTSRDGRQINVLVHTAPIRDPSGNIVSVMEMSANITELRQLQTQLASLGLVVGSISHGIKGLLSGLDGGIYLMDSGFAKGDLARTRQGWEMVRRNVDRIRSMVLNVLYYAKDRETQWESVDPRGLSEDAVAVLSNRAQQFGIELRVRAEQPPATVEADGRAMHALLVNLLENALDACRIDKRKERHAVELRVRGDGQAVVFEVQDDGIGMDRETREKAFSPFFSSKGAEGTGLGLFIAHKIAVKHGATIAIDSTPGAGTRFVVRLPLQRPPPADSSAECSRTEGGHVQDDPDRR